MLFIQVKAMGGVNYLRAQNIMGVQFTDREKCSILMTGGVQVPCYEAASAVVARIEEQMTRALAHAPHGKDSQNGDGSQ